MWVEQCLSVIYKIVNSDILKFPCPSKQTLMYVDIKPSIAK